MKISILTLAFLVGLLLPGCLGRQEDDLKPAPAANPTRPAGAMLLSFGAVWCKPCRKEIDDLNSLAERTKGRLQLKGYLVEDSKGKPATPQDLPKFVSPKGSRPQFEMAIDTGWSVLESFAPPEGRALPLLVLVNPDGSIYRKLQGLADFESEVASVVDAWLEGLATARPTPGSPPNVARGNGNTTDGSDPVAPGPTAPEFRSLKVATWLTLPSFHSEPAAEVVYSNMKASWEKGLSAAGFTRTEMPFEAGTVNLRKLSDAADTTVENWATSEGRWRSESNCTLTVKVTADGSYASSKGICR